MSGHARYELTSASPDSSFSGNYQNGQRVYLGPTLDRSSSFREGVDSRMFGSGKATPRVSATSSDVPALSQCLMLEPIATGDKKYGELRRILGFSVGSGSEDNAFGAAYLKNSPPLSVEEIKRLRASVSDTRDQASGRAKRLDEHLNKLNKYFESMTSKKQQRLELMTNERSSGSTLKIGSQIHRNSSELGNQKLDDRPKNVVLNKRVRSSVTETRAESRNNGVPRSSLVAKERELMKYNVADCDMAEEKIRRLPASGEGWDKKMKRKRSVGAVFSRSIDSDGEPKRTIHHKLMSESCLQASDSTHGFRSGASSGSKKLDPTSPAGSNARASLKNEQEKFAHSKDFSVGPNKERVLGKGNVKLNNREDNHTICPSPVVKGKASRAPRSASMIATSSTSNIPRLPGTLESWEQPQGVNKAPAIGGANNRKRAMPVGSSSPHITQWGGQRPHKISRTRRTNLLPVSNHDEIQMQSEACSPSSFGPRLSTGGTNAYLLSKGAATGNQNFKVKLENVPSPARLSESEESGAGENRIKEKGVGSGDMEEKAAIAGQNVGPSAIPTKKNKNVVKEEVGDGVRRQGRSGRVSPFSRSSISPPREKVDNVLPTKPLRNARSSSDKNGSKSGRPLKKLAERRGFPRLGHLANEGSPDCSGESDDDHEDLLEAANIAYNSSLTSCSSEFWKTVEPLFASIGPDEKSYLSLQLKLAEESCGNSSQDCSHCNNLPMGLDDYGHKEISASDPLSCRRNRCMKNAIGLDTLDRVEFVQQFQNSSLFRRPDAEKRHEMATPLYQRVLSALIVEDEIEESEETGFGRPRSSVNDSYHLIGNESKHMDRLNYREPILGVPTHKNGNPHMFFPCNGNTDFDRSPGARDHLCNGELLQGDDEYVHSEVEVSVRLTSGDYATQSLPVNNCGVSPIDCPYEQMSIEEKIVLELQSIGLFLENIPDLDDKEEEAIKQELVQLERGLHEQKGKKKTTLDKIYKAIQEVKKDGKRDPEHIAMDKLIELAYKKLLATRGSFATKHGIAKVSKQVALAFTKRTLARCQKFENSGASCFAEPAFRDIIYAAPPRFNETELLTSANPGVAKDGISLDAFATSAHQSDQVFAKNGPISNRGKKKEVLLDDVVGSAAFRASSALGILGGAKGKRSDRDRDRDTSTRNAVAKAGRSSMAGSKGDRKTKSKPKQKTAQLSTSGNGFVNKFTDTTNSVYTSASGSGESASNSGSRKRDVRFKSSSNIPPTSKEMKESEDLANVPLNDINGMQELGIDSEAGVPQDFNSWFSFEMDGLQDHDSVGLEIPMDELADINMF